MEHNLFEIKPQDFVISLLAFLLLVIIFKKFLWGPVLNVLDNRRKEIEDQYTDAEGKEKEADDLKAAYQSKIAGVDEEIRFKLSEAIKSGQKMRDEIIADSRVQAEAVIAKAMADIERENAMAMQELKETVVKLTIEASSKLIRENLDETKHHALVSSFIDDLSGVSK